MRTAVLLAASALIALTGTIITPAQADWRFSKWGMSVKAVAKASNGLAVPTAINERDDRGGTPLLKMPYSAGGGIEFTALFVFDEKERLAGVILDPENMSEACLALPAKLKAQYGKPESEGFSGGMADMTWRDRRGKNYVRYSGMSGYCVLSYAPLRSSASEGL